MGDPHQGSSPATLLTAVTTTGASHRLEMAGTIPARTLLRITFEKPFQVIFLLP